MAQWGGGGGRICAGDARAQASTGSAHGPVAQVPSPSLASAPENAQSANDNFTLRVTKFVPGNICFGKYANNFGRQRNCL